MKLPERLTKCPRTPECVAKVVFQNDAGELFRFDVRTQKFLPHKCNTQGASQLPTIAYAAAWENTTTGRTRFLGPERMRKSVEKPPSDERYKRRGPGENPNWKLIQVFRADIEWRPVED